ncbi:MAG: ligase-associated DNA damage response endonuclease PdeM [Alphaproteobacteria bacterium]
MTLAEHRSQFAGIDMAGEALLPDVSGALWWEAASTLIVSDLHLEKGSSYAERGLFLPPYDTAATLAALTTAIARFMPRRVIALGDSFHDRRALDRIDPSDMAALLALQSGRNWLWIVGNHDVALEGILPGDHAAVLSEGGLTFIHEPSSKPSSGEIAGHLHPAAKVKGRGRGVRRRAFITDGERMVMPAFGAYTGGLNCRDGAVEALFPRGFIALMMGDDRIYTVPQAHCWAD